MKIKKYIAMIMLFIATTVTVAAQSKVDGKFFGMSNVPLSAIEAGTADQTVVNQAKMNGKEVHNLLDAWCNYRVPGLTLQKLLTEGRKEAITVAHANCEALPAGLHPYWDNSPNGEVWMWGNTAILKDECGGNLVASSEGIILNFLKSYFSQSHGQESEVVKPRNDQPDKPKKEEIKNMENTTIVLANGASEYGPWWMWAIAALFVLGLIALLRPGARQRFISSLRDGWMVEDEILNQNERRIRRADDWQADRNDYLYRESERQRNRYRGDRPQ